MDCNSRQSRGRAAALKALLVRAARARTAASRSILKDQSQELPYFKNVVHVGSMSKILGILVLIVYETGVWKNRPNGYAAEQNIARSKLNV
jgi:hypothetical protein